MARAIVANQYLKLGNQGSYKSENLLKEKLDIRATDSSEDFETTSEPLGSEPGPLVRSSILS